MNGRTIKIFLVDGDPSGLRTVEVGLSTLKALIAPRAALEGLRAREEADRTGVYLLLGDDETAPGGVAVYIGEGDSVIDRIVRHESTRDFWHTVVLFTSKDDNLNKAHARWLEAQLVRMAKDAVRANVVNENQPSGGRLSEADVAEMSEVISQVRMVLGSVGFDVFAPLVQRANRLPGEPPSTETLAPPPSVRFMYSGTGFSAHMELSSGGYLVRQNSLARKEEAPSLNRSYTNLRERLAAGGVLVEEGSSFRFTADYLFRSPSAAAAVVSGTTIGGGVSWKLPNGTTLSDWEASRTTSSERTTPTEQAVPSAPNGDRSATS